MNLEQQRIASWNDPSVRWVCEEHPTKEQGHRVWLFWNCGGAGMPEDEVTVNKIANMIAGAGSNKISLKDDRNFTGTYWISANDLYFRITGRHLNADFDNGIIPRNAWMDDIATR
jgi:hypothetical protein